MLVNLNSEEVQFLGNLLINRREDPLMGAPSQQEIDLITVILTGFISGEQEYELQEIGYLQSLLQEQNEIWGSRRSTANEKSGTVGPGQNFVPHRTLVLIKSISDKLGAHLSVDVDTKADETGPRGEGSISIMNWLYPYKK